MKSLLLILFSFSFLSSFAQTNIPNPDKKIQIVDVSCGQCKLGLSGNDCDLAVRIDGKSYFVDGTAIDSHGDAHAKDGFCNAIRKAQVQGEVVNERYKVSYFKLMPEKKAKKAKQVKASMVHSP